MASRQSTGFKIIAAVLVVAVIFAIVEAALRLTRIDTGFQNRFFVLNRALDYPEVFERDAELFWRLRPNQTITSRFFEGRTYRINEYGLRGGPIAGTPASARVLLLGNSCMFGWGISDSQTIAKQTEQFLGEGFEVINAGVPGYTSLQGRRLFEKHLVDLEPTIVAVMFGWNDQWAAAEGIPDKEQEFASQWLLDVQNTLARLHTYRVMKKLILSTVEPSMDSLFDRSAPVRRVDTESFWDNLMAIGYLAETIGAVPILITEPQPTNPAYGEAVAGHAAVRYHQRYNRVVRELARQTDWPLVDAAAEFDRRDDLYDNPRRDFIHFNARGHGLIAQMLAETIAEID